MKKLFNVLFILLFPLVALAQTGSIKGIIKDAVTQEAIIGASVVVTGTTTGSSTDIEGKFLIPKLAPGTYNLTVAFVSYKPKQIPNIVVESGKTVVINAFLEENTTELTEVTISATRQTNTEIAVISEIREAKQIVSGISSEQIVKSQDRDAAEVVRRIPGVTVVDNRFIQIRGLNERYNAVWLNDVNAPSSETDRRAFSFDIIPSSLIDRVLVFKTISPDLPGDYAGGLVKVYTRSAAIGQRSLDISYTLGFRQYATMQPFNKDEGSSLDFLGFGSSHRALPNNFPVLDGGSPSQGDNAAKELNNDFTIKSIKPAPDQRISISYIDVLNLGKMHIGTLTAVNYSNTFTHFDIKRSVFSATGELSEAPRDDQSNNNVRVGIIQNFVKSLSKGGKIEFRNLFNQQGRNQITIRNSYDPNGSLFRKGYSLGYQTRTVYSGQLAGTHEFDEAKTIFKWVAGYNYSGKREPDLRRVVYAKEPDSDAFNLLAPAPGSVDIVRAGRLFQTLNENTFTINSGIERKMKIGNVNVDGSAGTYLEYKKRSFEARGFGYSPYNTTSFENIKSLPLGEIFAPKNIGSPNGFQLIEDIDQTFYYQAENKLAAAYVAGNFELTPKIKLMTGARYEYNLQSLTGGIGLNPSISTSFLLPSANLSYNITEKALIRAAYGKSLNRPEFREWSPFYYYDFDFNALNYGSLNLFPAVVLNVAQIDNFDLRYELYPSENEIIHLGAFYKKFKDPIESIVVPTTNLAYSYRNAPSAYIVGAELDIRKTLTKNFTGIFNATLLKSQVKSIEGVAAWDSTRTLQGQSPYVINAGIYYNSTKLGLQVSTMYNVFGPRIVFVGTQDYPDVVEMPRNTVDLTVTKTINKKFSLNLGVQDLFNQKVIFLQDFNKNGKFERSVDPRLQAFQRGTYYTVGLRFSM